MRSAATAETEISEGNWLLRDALWDRAERFLIGVLGTLAMLVGLVQVVGRYVAPRYAISWAEEVIVYLIVWGIMLAASQLVRTDGHVRPDLVLRAAPARIQRWMEVINCIAALAFCAAACLVRLEHRHDLLAVGRAQFVGPAISDVALLGSDTVGGHTYDWALPDQALSLSLRLRSPDDDGWRPHSGARTDRWIEPFSAARKLRAARSCC